MDMITISIQIPKAMAAYVEEADQKRTFERNAMMLYPFISKAVLSHGRAAEILGVRKWDLIEYYNSIGLPYINQSREELLADLETYKRLKEKGL